MRRLHEEIYNIRKGCWRVGGERDEVGWKWAGGGPEPVHFRLTSGPALLRFTYGSLRPTSVPPPVRIPYKAYCVYS